MADARVEIEATLKDRASRAIGTLRGKLGSLAGTLGTVVRRGALLGGAAVLGLGVAALKVGADFEKAYATIRIGTGATGEALKGLEADFKATLGKVPDSFDDVATATADLNTRTGATGVRLQSLSKQFLDLARITGEEVGPTIAAGTRVFGDWSIAVEDQSGSLDHLFKVSQATGIGVTELSEKVVAFGAPLRQMGFDFESATVLLGKWEKEGVNVEAILGAMKIGVANFAKEGVDAEEGLESFIKELTGLGPGAAATTRAIEVFGSRAGPDMAAAVTEGRFALEDLKAAVAASGETTASAAEDALTMGQKFTLLKNKVLVALEPVITRVFGALSRALDRLMPVIEREMPGAIEKMENAWAAVEPVIREFADTFRTGLETIWPPTQAFVRFLLDHKPLLIAALVAIGAAVVIAFGPASIAVAALVGIIFVVGLVKEHWEDLRVKFDEIVAKLDEKLGFLLDVFKGIWQDISNQVMFHINLIRGIIEIVMALIRGDWAEAWEAVKRTASRLWDNIQGIIGGKITVIKALVNGLRAPVIAAFGFIRDMAGAAMGQLADVIKGHANAIIGYYNLLIRGAEGVVNGIARALNSIPDVSIPGWVPGVGGKSFGIPDVPTVSIPRIPTLAAGGDVIRTGAAVVHAGERVGAPVTVNFAPGSVTLGGAARREDAEALVDMVERAIRDRRLRGV